MEPYQVLILALVAGLAGQILSGLFRLPSILFLLVIGVLVGPDGINWIDPDRDLGRGLEVIVRLGVALILFEGGMALHLKGIRKVHLSVRRLITYGVAITFAGAAVAAYFIAGLEFRQALLFGALVTVTGPTVIRPLVQRVKVRPEVAAVMEGEGILADPIGAILAAVCLEYALAPPGAEPLAQIQGFGIRLGIGLGIGGVVGAVAGLIVKYRAPSIERIKPLVVLMFAMGGYGLAEHVRHESGIMAMVAAGLAIQHGVAAHDRSLREFKELITTLLLSVLFVLLAANLGKEQMMAVGWPGLVTVLIVMVVIRPVSILFCTHGGKPTKREKIFLSWVAPRGIVAASVASLGALIMEERHHPDARAVESRVFLTVFLTVFLQGGTAGPVAWLLGITVKEARSILIIGAGPIARALGQAYRAAGKRVTLVDRNPVHVERAAKEGLEAVCGDGTDRETLHIAGIDETDILVAMTPSTTVNQTVAQVALHDRHVEAVWVALDETERRSLDPVLGRQGVEILLGRAVPLDAWEDRLENGDACFLEVEVTAENLAKARLGEVPFLPDVIPFLVRRGDRIEAVRDPTRLQVGDRLTVLTRTRHHDTLRRTLGRAVEEKK